MVLPEEGVYTIVLWNTHGNTERPAVDMMTALVNSITGGDCEAYRTARIAEGNNTGRPTETASPTSGAAVNQT